MLNLKFIEENPKLVIQRLNIKNFDATQIVDQIIGLYDRKKDVQTKADHMRAEMNNLSKKIGKLFQEKKIKEANQAKARTSVLKDGIKESDDEFAKIDSKIFELQVLLPNMPSEIVPAGKTSEENVVVKKCGDIPDLSKSKLPHWELTSKYDIIDFELGVKITGAGFPVYKGQGARLQRSLINFFLDQARDAGYLEIEPPYMVNEDSGFGTGQLPDKEGQMYYTPEDKFYLIPTAEVPVTNIYRDVVLDEKDLPIKNTAYSACFRREAGSYGKDVRGLNRLHQFNKVELVQIVKPEGSYKVLDEMVAYVESLVKKLELPYRIVRLCGGDLSFTSALTYDFEVFSAAQEKWLEVSSVSNFESFQSTRLKLRYRDKDTKKTVLAHTLNGSALALPRIVAALLENNQTPDGIKIPKVLIPYCGFDMIK